MAPPSPSPSSAEHSSSGKRQRQRYRYRLPSKKKKKQPAGTTITNWRVLAVIGFLLVALLATIVVIAIHVAAPTEEY